MKFMNCFKNEGRVFIGFVLYDCVNAQAELQIVLFIVKMFACILRSVYNATVIRHP